MPRNVSFAIIEDALEGVVLERAQFGALVQGVEVTLEPAPDHVALEHDVVAGREHRRVALALRHLATPQDADLDQRPLGQLAEQRPAEVVIAIVERDDRGAAEDDRAEALLGFSSLFDAVITGHRRPEQWQKSVHQIALPVPGGARNDVHGRRRLRAAHEHGQDSG